MWRTLQRGGAGFRLRSGAAGGLTLAAGCGSVRHTKIEPGASIPRNTSQ
ncbi:MAG: hypothetical protein LAQ30_13790 [Acidobacteriia bacterium]|nr:hypothetical protein [Terriglobia bacterium]